MKTLSYIVCMGIAMFFHLFYWNYIGLATLIIAAIIIAILTYDAYSPDTCILGIGIAMSLYVNNCGFGYIAALIFTLTLCVGPVLYGLSYFDPDQSFFWDFIEMTGTPLNESFFRKLITMSEALLITGCILLCISSGENFIDPKDRGFTFMEGNILCVIGIFCFLTPIGMALFAITRKKTLKKIDL